MQQIFLICTKTKSTGKTRKNKYPCGARKNSKCLEVRDINSFLYEIEA
jgi:hypothetical protein